MTDLLNIHNLKVEFDTDEGRILAVDNVILKLQEGQILGLVGESGSGKSVTAKSIMQLNKDILSARYIFNEQIITKEHLHYELIIKIIKLLKDENSRKIRKSCPLCNNLEANIISERDRYGLPVTFLICLNCGLIFSKEYFSDSFASFYYKTIYNEFKDNMSSEELFLLRTKPNSPSSKRYEFIRILYEGY